MPSIPPSDRPEPCVLVIFGASGDLTHRKLIPALYELYEQNLLPERCCVVGVSRTPMTDHAFREKVAPSVEKFAAHFDKAKWADFARRVHYHAADASKLDDYDGLSKRIESLADQHGVPRQREGSPNILFYLSVAPELYDPIITCIGAAGMVSEGKRWCVIDKGDVPWQRIIVEKPFGSDLNSAIALNRTLGQVFEEESIYRIDHYLGKELVQNILVMRFGNRIFEPIWSAQHVDHVQVTAAETVGVGSRAANFYDGSGAMRDMIQSHLLQVMALVAMEPPSSYNADALSRERIKLFKSIRPIPAEDAHQHAAFGRYAAADGEPAYTEEKGVDPARKTDTYAAMRVHIDNFRWAGTPFYLRSGKKLARKLTEVVVQFKAPPAWMFRGVAERPPNRIVINIAPDDGVSIRLEAKVPGPKLTIDSVKLDMDYSATFNAKPVEAYGPLLLDAMRGDRMLYKHREEVEGAWTVCQPLLDSTQLRSQIQTYKPNSWGPDNADQLMSADARKWHNPRAAEKR
ncbi:MAG: glucose-6-phosphate dehydrogenase [Phycisphaerales bacterium]|nr:glucose-6-phosphate dehydrogenase [Phycisphaerales bacterium]